MVTDDLTVDALRTEEDAVHNGRVLCVPSKYKLQGIFDPLSITSARAQICAARADAAHDSGTWPLSWNGSRVISKTPGRSISRSIWCAPPRGRSRSPLLSSPRRALFVRIQGGSWPEVREPAAAWAPRERAACVEMGVERRSGEVRTGGFAVPMVTPGQRRTSSIVPLLLAGSAAALLHVFSRRGKY